MNSWEFPRFIAEKRDAANCGKNILPILLCIDCMVSARKANSKNEWKASNMLIFKGENPMCRVGTWGLLWIVSDF